MKAKNGTRILWTPEEDDHLVSFGITVHVDKYPNRTRKAAELRLHALAAKRKNKPVPSLAAPTLAESFPPPKPIVSAVTDTPDRVVGICMEPVGGPLPNELCRVPFPVSADTLRALSEIFAAAQVSADGPYLILTGG